MADLILKDKDIVEIIKGHLKIEQKVMSIDALFRNERLTNRINYAPYYQRNYVWDKNKASYFIESILLGTEIPPLVFFNNGEKIEVIDGRQRFETIKRYLDKDFSLTKKGLFALRKLEKRNFDDLGDDIKEIFYDTKVRIIEFSIVNEPRLDAVREDLIKKEIFRRYNSGITPLKKPEIDRAKYINDTVTSDFKEELTSGGLKKVLDLFFTDRDGKGAERTVIEKVMTKVRQLMILHNVPIKRYSTLQGRDDILSLFYEEFIQKGSLSSVELYRDFEDKIEILEKLKSILPKLNEANSSRLMMECTFWALAIMEKEGKENSLKSFVNDIEDYSNFLVEGQDNFAQQNNHFYRNINERYTYVANYFKKKYSTDYSIYLDDYSEFRENIKILNELKDPEDVLSELEQLRLNKPEPSNLTIQDIARQMSRNRFLIRPAYQRVEVINRAKSSALIESILLDIKLPPIFIFKRPDGVFEVVDGQQRLLSILGFIGGEFKDENDSFVKSEKNKFKLSKLTVLNELNGKKFDELEERHKDKILDFNLSVVIIDSKLNQKFDPIDLFIRLNNKPYPIKENSFEMWNSYIDRDIISKIKEKTSFNSSWFHFKTNEFNSRMDNEELYTSLAYLEHQNAKEDLSSFLDIYAKGGNINVRIKDKSEITSLLKDVTLDVTQKELFEKSIARLEKFIKMVKGILEVSEDESELSLKNDLNQLMNLKTQRRTIQSFYTLWYILKEVSYEKIISKKEEAKMEIQTLFGQMKSGEPEANQRVLDEYLKEVKSFNLKFS